MFNAHIGLVLIAPLLLVLGNAASSRHTSSSRDVATQLSAATESARFKCRNSVQKNPLNFVDGHLVSNDSITRLVKSADGVTGGEHYVEYISVSRSRASISTAA